ncbi:hypothetical protein BJY04DRAFT_221541 [Aspergillus karnatakaensis]|uniref:uncharacterized protein n=1 Tax=Aspergillus karnatakaensis TaxID=1810916 RepID=UPI003CCE1139
MKPSAILLALTTAATLAVAAPVDGPLKLTAATPLEAHTSRDSGWNTASPGKDQPGDSGWNRRDSGWNPVAPGTDEAEDSGWNRRDSGWNRVAPGEGEPENEAHPTEIEWS